MTTHNARIEVQAWRESNHLTYWNEPARSEKPSTIWGYIARARTEICHEIDKQANRLRDLGFQDGHETMRQLRGDASKAARRANDAALWAGELRIAENEAEPS